MVQNIGEDVIYIGLMIFRDTVRFAEMLSCSIYYNNCWKRWLRSWSVIPVIKMFLSDRKWLYVYII